MNIEMKIEGIMFDSKSSMYILLLKAVNGNDTLPIWIGKPEADSIALALGNIATPRPLSHDLLKNILTRLDIMVSRILVRALVDNTYYASIYISDGRSEIAVDSRPSDAVAVALRTSTPIFVDDNVIKTQHTDELDKWLEDLRPEDFGDIM